MEEEKYHEIGPNFRSAMYAAKEYFIGLNKEIHIFTIYGCTTFRPSHSGPRLSGPLLLGLNVAKIGPERRT